jgi:6-phosphofructokinase 2
MTAILTLTMNPALDVFTSTPALEPSHKLRCAAPRLDPGGGGINVARVLTRLGADALALHPLGGATGERLGRLLAAEGVRAAGIPIAEETRESFTVKEGRSGREYRFVLPGPSLSAAECRACLDAVQSHAAGARWLVVSGSMPEGIGADFIPQLAARCRGAGVRIAIDTSGAALREWLAQGVDLVKPSLRELSELTGEPLATRADQLHAARAQVLGGQAAIVALSLGADGALLVTRDEALHAAALPVEVSGTIGAGDSFLAGLLLGVDRAAGLDDALGFAVAAASAALLTEGTSLCRPEDVERLRGLVRIERLHAG